MDKVHSHGNLGVRASVGKLQKIYSLAYGELTIDLIEKWKRALLNYVFMGCLPRGVEKAKLYYGNVLKLPMLQVQEHFTEKELTFTCYSSVGKRLLEKANDATDTKAIRRKRTLKRQMKQRDLQQISEDSSKIKYIDDFFRNLTNLKRLHQQILDQFEKILDNVELCEQLPMDQYKQHSHIPMAVIKQWLTELWQSIYNQCKVVNE
jgi:hypothetical protein